MKPIAPPPVYRDRCTYASKYKAKRRPTCGCQVCATKWAEAEVMRDMCKSAKEAEHKARKQAALLREAE